MSSLKEWEVTKPWLDAHCSLGEGPFFEKESNSVRFVDIQQKRLHSVPLNGDMASLQTTQLDVPVTVTANIDGVDPTERILIGVKSGLAILDRKTGSYEVINQFTEQQNDRLRSNDGASDAQGRFWIGTMTDFGQGDFRPEGTSTPPDYCYSVIWPLPPRVNSSVNVVKGLCIVSMASRAGRNCSRI